MDVSLMWHTESEACLLFFLPLSILAGQLLHLIQRSSPGCSDGLPCALALLLDHLAHCLDGVCIWPVLHTAQNDTPALHAGCITAVPTYYNLPVSLMPR